jgi:hypothetical protein
MTIMNDLFGTGSGLLGRPLGGFGGVGASQMEPQPFQQLQWPRYERYYADYRRENFLRTCSQHWLDRMIDIELG